MNAVPFDTLKLARGPEEAGMPPQMAAGTVAALAEAIGSSELATKDDVSAVRADVSAVKSAVNAVRAEIAAAESRLMAVIAAFKADVDRRFEVSDAKLELLRRDMTIKLGGMLIVATGVILAALRFMPHS
ncbi:MAG TPA: hypothetical protein VMB73_08060 [Acetobacteraceae bacterium]|nr:hypothetical protein [Acetobacteraceae bacterium]